MRFLRGLLLLLLTAATLHGQNYTQAYTQIVVFGDSLSDTGNFARTTQAAYGVRIPGPLFGYTDGRFTDGLDTAPAARLYTGVWLEQLAATLTPVPAVKDSLDGGTNYAYGGATNATGTSQFALAAGFAVPVPNVGAQIATYLATKPAITSKTLFIVWGGGNDLLNALSASGATTATVTAAAQTAAQQAMVNLQTLITAGATQFIVPNVPPLGAIPRINGNSTNAAAATSAAALYNSALAAGLAAFAGPNPAVKFYPLDVYTLFSSILVSPAVTGFANVTNSAQGNATINPDTYLFWDDLHPTTYGHNLLSLQAHNLLTQSTGATATLGVSSAVANPSQVVTLTAKAAGGTTGIPSGLFTFYFGTTPVATVLLDATGTATSPFTAPATTGTYTLGVRYSGDATFIATSAQSMVTVAPSGYTFTASPTTVTVVHGSTGTSTLTLTPTGNLTGTYTPACGTLPSYVTCTFSSTTLTAANNTAVSTTLSLGTSVTASATIPARPGSRAALPVFTAFTLLGGLAFASRRRKALRPGLLGVLALLTLAGTTALTGCGGSGSSGPTTHTAAAGSYTIPITLTPTVSGSTNTLNLTLVVQ